MGDLERRWRDGWSVGGNEMVKLGFFFFVGFEWGIYRVGGK